MSGGETEGISNEEINHHNILEWGMLLDESCLIKLNTLGFGNHHRIH